MPRRKISEYRAKKLVYSALNEQYTGWSVQKESDIQKVKGFSGYVLKVDQAVKGRFKKGLVHLDIKHADIAPAMKKMQKDGYTSFLVEPYIAHADGTERYLAILQVRDGIQLTYSALGGVDIESHSESLQSVMIKDDTDWDSLEKATGISAGKLSRLVELFRQQHFTMCEINPYIIDGAELTILDTAVEVDDAAAYFVDGWSEKDIRTPKLASSYTAEAVVRKLDTMSPASFNLSVLNPNGSIFLLLSGGGASVVIADEICNNDLGEELANYGEYSGNPNADETYIYTKELLKLMVASKAKKKVLFIGGAVANFTNIANTFAGVIKALDEVADELHKQKVRIYVRRGGPHQEIGLQRMRTALEKYGLLGGVYDPTTSITDALGAALKEVK